MGYARRINGVTSLFKINRFDPVVARNGVPRAGKAWSSCFLSHLMVPPGMCCQHAKPFRDKRQNIVLYALPYSEALVFALPDGLLFPLVSFLLLLLSGLL